MQSQKVAKGSNCIGGCTHIIECNDVDFAGCANSSNCSLGPCWARVIVMTTLFVVVFGHNNGAYVAAAAAPGAPYTSPAPAPAVRTAELVHRSSVSPKHAGGGDEAQQELLAVKHNRRDPLQHFKPYKGGYNLQSKHYLASTLFTGIHGYFLGTIWLLGGVLGAMVLHCKHSCRRRQEKAVKVQHFVELSQSSTTTTGQSKIRFVPMILTTVLIALIVFFCGLACVESQKFHILAKKVESTLIEEGANNATRMIDNVTKQMGEMKMDIEQYDQRAAQRLDNTTMKLNNASTTLLKNVRGHKSNLDSALLGLNVGVFVIAATNITLWTFGFACFVISSKLRRLFFMILSFLWILTSLNWFSFGVTYAINNFSFDTCEALKEYKESSKNTTLDNVLPCRNLAMGSKVVLRLRQNIFHYIDDENRKIANFTSKQIRDKRLNAEMDDLSIKNIRICNPFLGPPMYLARDNCNDGTISISSLPKLLSLLKCKPGNSTKNSDVACISTSQYKAAIAYISATKKLLSMLPEVENLTDCSFVVNTFTIVLQSYCKSLKHSMKMVWLAMVLLATLSTFTILLWLLQLWILRKYSHSFVQWGGTIMPHNITHSPL